MPKYWTCNCLNPLPNDKILDLSKLKVFADDKIYLTEKLKFLFRRVENIIGKGENTVTSIVFFSHNVFKSLLIQGCCDLWVFFLIFFHPTYRRSKCNDCMETMEDVDVKMKMEVIVKVRQNDLNMKIDVRPIFSDKKF